MGKTIYCLLFTHWRVVYQSCARMGLFEAVTGRQFIQCEMLEQTRHSMLLADKMKIILLTHYYKRSRWTTIVLASRCQQRMRTVSVFNRFGYSHRGRSLERLDPLMDASRCWLRGMGGGQRSWEYLMFISCMPLVACVLVAILIHGAGMVIVGLLGFL